ncbi:MAG: hypothetical protein CMM60_04535 [Rhodospirillaceae bacterium]|jgi:hypothetical protein|nr:hypothetical protein [Rhodospirillaceae bacterium]|tara:strand:+ start:2665 stop:3183 length:519 start_codon:yes stop_codon:yes gene_type:complete
MVIREGELEFDFSGAREFEKLDRQERDAASRPIPHGMKFVDFVVEEEDRVLLIEVKDPSCGQVPSSERTDFLKRMEHKTLIHYELVPKARDTYTFLHLMKRDEKPFFYVVLLGLEEFNLDALFLPNFKDRLLQRLRQESDHPWRRDYVADCVVATVSNWRAIFPNYPLTRAR